MNNINETVKAIVESYKETPIEMIEEFPEVVHSVCIAAMKNADYDINLHSYEDSSVDERFAAYIFMAQYAYNLGLGEVLLNLDPMAYADTDDGGLLVAMISIASSYIEAKKIATGDTEVTNTDFIATHTMCDLPWRISDSIITYFSLLEGFDAITNDKGTMTPLQSLYYKAWYCNGQIDDSGFSMANVYENIIEPSKFETDEDLNKGVLLIKTLYDKAFLYDPIGTLSWIRPDDENDGFHELPGTLLVRLYTIHVQQLVDANTDRDQIEAYMNGNIHLIDSVLLGAISSTTDATIDNMVANSEEVNEAVLGLYKALINAYISYINSERLDDMYN